jgi:hypothetical protein
MLNARMPFGTSVANSENLTAAEEAILQRLLTERPPYVDVWLHADAEGRRWRLIALDFAEAGAVRDTLDLDFDGASIAVGWSPSFLNGDEGIKAEVANIFVASPDGIQLGGSTRGELADAARHWFDAHWRVLPTSAGRARWNR